METENQLNYRVLQMSDDDIIEYEKTPCEPLSEGKETRGTIGYDTWANSLYGLPYPLYFYVYSRKAFGSDAENFSIPLGNCPTVQNVQYAPYFYWSDFNIRTINYDNGRFGDGDPLRPSPTTNPLVYRIVGLKSEITNRWVGNFQPFKNMGQNPGHKQKRSWKNESRLHQYPYRRIYLMDGFNQPFEIKTSQIPYYGNNNVYVKCTLSDRMTYSIYVKDYKGDVDGKMEAMVSGDNIELPSSSSYYSQWLATNRNATSLAVKQQIAESQLNTTQGINANNLALAQAKSNVYTNTLIGSGIIGRGKTYIGAQRDAKHLGQQTSLQNKQAMQTNNLIKKFAIESAIAKSQDASTTPPTMLSMGSDFVYGYLNNDKALKCVVYQLSDINANKLGDYFALYGYKVNRIYHLSTILKTRYYYNYIKTENAQITSRWNVPREHLEEINRIFDNGCTFWHIDREGVKFGDYTYDNAEVWI